MSEANTEQIIIYKINNLYSRLEKYIKDNEKDFVEEDEDSLKSVCNRLNEYIRGLFNNSKQIISETRQIQFVARGSSSICYRNTDPTADHSYLYKVFSPFEFSCVIPVKKPEDIKKFCLIPDCAEHEYRKKLLRRFIRFIKQKKKIDLCLKEARNNSFQDSALYFSSKGFVYEVPFFKVSETLDKKFHSLTEKSLTKLFEIVKLVNKTAKNIRDFCHCLDEDKSKVDSEEQLKFFHGDIKPENFLVIYTQTKENEYFVRNIDFDTWASSKEIKEGYLKNFAATTSLYYDIDSEHTSQDQSFEDWCCYDVQALGRVLMYALSILVGYDLVKNAEQGKRFGWKEYFFKYGNDKIDKKSCPAKEIFDLLEADKNLSDLFIFEQLKDLLLWCETRGPRDVIKFIERLTNIEQLIEYKLRETKPEKYGDLFIRYLGLLQFDSQIQNRSPFAKQCFGDLMIEEKDKGFLKLEYKIFTDEIKEGSHRVSLLPQDFVLQVLDKCF